MRTFTLCSQGIVSRFMADDAWLAIPEAAEYLGISRPTMQRPVTEKVGFSSSVGCTKLSDRAELDTLVKR